MQSYVCGFAFNKAGTKVVLIEKTKPAHLTGFLNGVGGKVEVGESLETAMDREMTEETGVEIEEGNWQVFAVLNRPDGVIHFLRIFTDDIDYARTVESEQVTVRMARDLPFNVYPNLRYLIPLALARDVISPVILHDIAYAEKEPSL